jgi:diguanylate cyclase (GGDEF)-like protein
MRRSRGIGRTKDNVRTKSSSRRGTPSAPPDPPGPTEPFEDTAVGGLADAWRALDAGDAQKARNIGQSALIAAKARSDLHGEAHALTCLAHADRIDSRLRRASETSRRAAQVFQRLGDVEGEAGALTTLAHVAVLLGRNDEAVEAAILCVRLCDPETPTPQGVLAYNGLGIAYGWSGNFERANAALALAVEIAGLCDPPVSAYQPLLNQAWIEASRLAEERYQAGRMGDLTRLAALIDDFRALEGDGAGATVMPGLMPAARTVSLALGALLAAWRGEVAPARREAELAVRSLGGIVTWLDAVVHWVLAELAWLQSDWKSAEIALREMKELGLAVEHEQLACMAHLLLVQVFEQQGKVAAAQQEQRALRSRERRMRSDSVSSREAVVKWQLGARQSEAHLKRALVESKQFERWSFEDPLTGIANRRYFEQELSERLRRAASDGRPLTVAMIDLDHFKAVNDTYTHQVGDRVLNTLAGIMATAVRQGDLPARLAGDEFVVLFHDADANVATEICERIRTAIAAFDWSSIAPGLHASVSIGIATAVDGDTVGTLLHRSDQSMYTVKASGFRSSY